MTQAQQEDLMIEWDLYSEERQDAIISEYCRRFRGNLTKATLYEFLKDRLEIEGYWKKVGLA